MNRFNRLFWLLLAVITFQFSGCDPSDNPDDGNDPNGETADYALFINEGAISLELGRTYQYTATLVSIRGEITNPTVTWSFENTSEGESVATITNSGLLTSSNLGIGLIKATHKINGREFSTTVPFEVYTPSLFVVQPSIILWYEDESPIQLEPLYLGSTDSPLDVSYTSSNNNVVTVSASGLVTFVGAGECTITATLNSVSGSPTQTIPILVLGTPNVALAVAKVEISPQSFTFFAGETKKFEANVYDGEGNLVTDKRLVWEVVNLEEDEDGNEIIVGEIQNDGTFTAKSFGQAQINCTVEGVVGKASVLVLPEFGVVIEPSSVSLKPGGGKQFTATTYPFDKDTKTLSNTPLANQPTLTWNILDFGIDMFNIGDVNQTGLVSIKEDATPGLFGVLMAIPSEDLEKYSPGISIINIAFADECDCGESDPNASSLDVEPAELNFSLSTFELEAQIIASVKTANGTTIDGALIKYCSDNAAVVSVDDEGNARGLGIGEAIITVCHGELFVEIPISVTF